MKLKHLSIAVALAASSASSFAGAPNFIDARAAAMGGVGVTVARPRAASFFNPALLAVKQPEKSDSFGMLTPSVMAFADDEDELVDTVDDFEDDFVTPFEDAITALEDSVQDDIDNALGAPSATTLAALDDFDTQTEELNTELNRINNDQVNLDLGAGIAFAVPSRTFGVSLFTSTSVRVNASMQYRDESFFEQLSLQSGAIRGGALPADPIIYNPGDDDTSGDLQSSVRGLGAGTTQAGISLATSFDVAGYDVSIGISPKIVDYRAYDLVADVDDFEEDDLEDSEVSDKSTNFDIGAAMYLDPTKNWLVGLSVQNLMSQEIKTDGGNIAASTNEDAIPVSGVTFELQPTITTGISYSTESFVVAADLQLNETDGFHTVDGIQMIGLGAEYDLGSFVQFRLGARHNIAGDGDPILTGGLGLDIFGATVELAGMGNSNAMGAALQVGAMF